jgi:DNA-binding NarL/FixJ family response regulator
MHSSPSLLHTILIVESDAGHQAHLTQYVQNQCKVSLLVKEDVSTALSHLESVRRNPASLPTLLLVDYQAMLRSGYTLLEELEKRQLKSCIPVIVLSDTDEKSVIEEAYDRGVASYFMKPRVYREWHSFLNLLIQYWFTEVTLPAYRIARQGA